MDAIDELVAADQVDHTLPPGREVAKAFVGMYLSAFPDTKMTMADIVAVGDKVVTRWRATGTHTGELMGIPATASKQSLRASILTVTMAVRAWNIGANLTRWARCSNLT